VLQLPDVVADSSFEELSLASSSELESSSVSLLLLLVEEVSVPEELSSAGELLKELFFEVSSVSDSKCSLDILILFMNLSYSSWMLPSGRFSFFLRGGGVLFAFHRALESSSSSSPLNCEATGGKGVALRDAFAFGAGVGVTGGAFLGILANESSFSQLSM